MRCLGVLAAMIVIGASSASGASSAPKDRSAVGGSVRTVATIKGAVEAFAQNRRYLAWLLAGPLNGYGTGNVGAVDIKDLRSGRVERLPAHPGSAGSWISMGLDGLALSGGRAFWGQTYQSFNTLDAQLASASVGDRRLRGVCKRKMCSRPASSSSCSPLRAPPSPSGHPRSPHASQRRSTSVRGQLVA